LYWAARFLIEIILTGPGVGIISTFPADKYAVLDGTSMACPAVTGAAAKLLSGRPEILARPRDQSRSDTMTQVLLKDATSLAACQNYRSDEVLAALESVKGGLYSSTGPEA
jgi:subtilisin